ncbi:MAG: TIM barrel protein [Armatimonadetes bacterium]|nr:TIM barrel protein [Armatimonadota bacterium]
MGKIRLGIGPIGWANDDLRGWGPEVTGEQIMREMAEAGFEGSEMSYLYPQDPLVLSETLARHGLVLASAYHWTNLSNAEKLDLEMEKARRHVDFCANAGARHVLFAEGGGSLHWDADGPRDTVRPLDDAAWERFAKAINAIGIYGRSRLMQVCVHPHAGTAIERQPEVERFLSLTDAEVVHWCLDTGHAALGGLDSVAMIRRWGHRIRYVHTKDVRGDVLERVQRDRPTFTDAVRANVFGAPGQGCLDFDLILEALLGIGYEGWLIVEADQDPGANPALQVAKDANACLREILSGLAVA